MAKIGKNRVQIIPGRYKLNDIVTVKTRLIHPQQNGRFKNRQGEYIPAHHLTQFTATYGDEEIIRLDLSASIAVNPFFDFSLKATKSAPIRVEWKDNQGGVYRQEATISV